MSKKFTIARLVRPHGASVIRSLVEYPPSPIGANSVTNQYENFREVRANG